jgi:hypothetical protein
MSDRPILFSAPMVRAILAGAKTQTRRVLKEQPQRDVWPFPPMTENDRALIVKRCPYGVPGDRLWVREAHWFFQDEHDPVTGYTPPVLTTEDVEYRADGESTRHGWRPSIHMPRWASRITLNITGVRVERLQAISEDDARAEGCHGPEDDVANNLPNCHRCAGTGLYTAFAANGGAMPDTDCDLCDTPAKRFRLLWGSINGTESWDANPWVWVVEFQRAKSGDKENVPVLQVGYRPINGGEVQWRDVPLVYSSELKEPF